MKQWSLLLVLMAVPACFTTRRAEVVETPAAGEAAADPSDWFAIKSQQPPLHPRDEGAFDAPEPGFVIENGPFPHDFEDDGTGGRMYLLELYQQALEHSEALEREVAGLTTTLDETYRELDTLQEEVRRAKAQTEQLEADVKQLGQENTDLAARLATAQIRRLEAEKMLLEAKIEWAEFLRQDELMITGNTPAPPRGQ